MEKKFAQFLSYLLHPFWMPLYMIILLYFLYGEHNLTAWRYVFSVVALNTIILPLFVIWLMKRMQLIKSFSLHTKQDRLLSFLITGMFYMSTWYIFQELNLIPLLNLILLMSAILVLMASFISAFWKISIHSISIGAVSAAVLYLTINFYISGPWLLYFVVFLSGLVGFARLKLNAHSPKQVYVGYFMGFMVLSFFMWVKGF